MARGWAGDGPAPVPGAQAAAANRASVVKLNGMVIRLRVASVFVAREASAWKLAQLP
jgi:hypothetical protein